MASILKGAWKFKDFPSACPEDGFYVDVMFISVDYIKAGATEATYVYDTALYNKMIIEHAYTPAAGNGVTIRYSDPSGREYAEDVESLRRRRVCELGSWENKLYKTVDFGPNGCEITNASFYSWFTENATQVEEGFYNPTKKQTQVVSGKWRFNDVINPTETPHTEIICVDGVNSSIYVGKTIKYTEMAGILDSRDPEMPKKSETTNNFKIEVDLVEKPTGAILDFSSAGQIVTQDFYTWLEANAYKITAVLPSLIDGTVNGRYVLFKNVDSSLSLETSQNINCVVGSYLCKRIEISMNGTNSNTATCTVYINNAWTTVTISNSNSEDERTIDFGQTNQYVSETFAQDLPKIAERIIEDRRGVGGVWNLADDFPVIGFKEMIRFYSGGKVFDGLISVADGPYVRVYYGSKLVYDGATVWWVDEKYKTIDFGTTYQPISNTLHDRLMGQAEKIAVYTIKESTLQDIANAIRNKSGMDSNSKIPVSAFSQAIKSFTNPSVAVGVMSIVEGNELGASNVLVIKDELIIT